MQFYLKCVAFAQAIILSAAMVHIYHLNNQNDKLQQKELPQKEIFSPSVILRTSIEETEKNELLQNLSDSINEENQITDPSLFGSMKES